MRKEVNNLEYFKNKFIEKSNKRHNNKYKYDKVVYVNSTTKVEVVCDQHGSFFVRPDAHIRKVGCPKCNGGVKYTSVEFTELCNKKYNFEYDYSLVDYKNSTKKVKIICKQHGVFEMSPSAHLIGQKCPHCSGVARKNNTSFINESIFIHGEKYDYSLVEYINNRTKVKIICSDHGIFEQTPKDHIRGSGCNKCSNFSSGEKLIEEILTDIGVEFNREFKFDSCKGEFGNKLPFDFFIPSLKMLIEFDGRQHFESVDKFGGEEYLSRLKINDEIKNKWCLENNINLIRINYKNIKEETKKLISTIEREINKSDKIIDIVKQKDKFNRLIMNKIDESILNKNEKFLKYFENSYFEIKAHIDAKMDIGNCLSKIYKGKIVKNFKIDQHTFDYYIPDKNVSIKILSNFKDCEINSDMYDSKNRSEIDKMKVIHLFSDTYKHKKDIIISRLRNILGTNLVKIYGRNCLIRELDILESSKFINENHIQGNVGSSVKLGLFNKEKLVSVMTFGKKRKSLGSKSQSDEWEMIRFCNKLNTTVIGSASKLMIHFIKNYNPSNIITYADKCWSSEDNLYEKIGMKRIHTTKPSYFYIIGNKRIGRFAYRKSELVKFGFNEKKFSEHSICLNMSIFRIYDCGTIKYEWSNDHSIN